MKRMWMMAWIVLLGVGVTGCSEVRLEQARKQVAEIVAEYEGNKMESGAFVRPTDAPRSEDGAYELEMDPWGKPIRLYFERAVGSETMTARSAGPDGVYLNTDDIYMSARTEVTSPLESAVDAVRDRTREVVSGALERVQEQLKKEEEEAEAEAKTPSAP